MPKNIQRMDFIRYIVLHKFGGAYFDFDMTLAFDLKRVKVHESIFHPNRFELI